MYAQLCVHELSYLNHQRASERTSVSDAESEESERSYARLRSVMPSAQRRSREESVEKVLAERAAESVKDLCARSQILLLANSPRARTSRTL